MKKNIMTMVLCGWFAMLACAPGNAAASYGKCGGIADNGHKRMVEGRKLIDAGEPQRAITECLQPLIDAFEKARQGSEKRFYSAQNQVQSFVYIALPVDKGQAVEVVSGDWADAYLMKAYALTD